MPNRLEPDELAALMAEAAALPKPFDDRYRIDISTKEGCLLLQISGTVLQPIPTEFSDRLERLLERGAGRRVILDLSACAYISSSVIGTLVSFFGASAKADGQMVMVRPPARVEGVLKAVALDQFFLIVDSEAIAIDFFKTQESGRRWAAVRPNAPKTGA